VMPRRERLSYISGGYEGHVTRAMRAHVRPGMVTYDIGAHIGYLSLTLARLAGGGGLVVAVEADPRNRAMLIANVAANRATNVRVDPRAVSDAVGSVRFATFPGYSTVSQIDDGAMPADAVFIDVPATTLDALAYGGQYPPPSFIKIDVEGAETQVFRGGERVLSEARPVIVAEARRGETLEEVRELAGWHRYIAQVLDTEGKHAAEGLVEVLFTPSS